MMQFVSSIDSEKKGGEGGFRPAEQNGNGGTRRGGEAGLVGVDFDAGDGGYADVEGDAEAGSGGATI